MVVRKTLNLAIKIFCEDSYGREFFKKLANRLKDENIISRGTGINTDRLRGLCSTKLRRILTAALYSYNKVIIQVDAHGHRPAIVNKQVEQHIPVQRMKSACIVVLDYEIEEWLCFSEGLRVQGSPSPYEILKQRRQYEKHRLPSYAEKLNIVTLGDYPSFKRFIDALKCLI